MEILAEETCTITLCGIGCMCFYDPDSFVWTFSGGVVSLFAFPIEGQAS
jgi:hypothetical protein